MSFDYGHPERDEPSLAADIPFGAFGPSLKLTENIKSLLIKLPRHFRERRVTCASSQLSPKYIELIGGLRERFDVGIYNLNYDNVALSAWPDAYSGFRDGVFDPRGILRRDRWEFIYHLHGSVHFTMVQSGPDVPLGKIKWQDDLAARFHDVIVPDEGSDKMVCLRSTLVAGGFKSDQLLFEPFHTFSAMLSAHAYEADAILIGGYGFGDAHVNQALANCLDNTDVKPRVMVLSEPARSDTDCMEFRDDLWADELCRILGASRALFREPGRAVPPHISELARNGAFEVDPEHGIAIWHGGFVEAVSRLDAISRWMRGGTDEVLIPD